MLLALSASVDEFIRGVSDKTVFCFMYLVEKRLAGNTKKPYCNCFHWAAYEYNLFLLAVHQHYTIQQCTRHSLSFVNAPNVHKSNQFKAGQRRLFNFQRLFWAYLLQNVHARKSSRELLPLDFWLVSAKRWREPSVNSQVHCLQTQLVACQSSWSSNSVTQSISCISNLKKEKLFHAHDVPSKNNGRDSSSHSHYLPTT